MPIARLNILRDVTERLGKMWKAIPETIRYDPSCWNSGQPYHECYMRLLIYLDYLYTHFLLQRALVKHTRITTDLLFESARKLLANVLTLANERDRLLEYQSDLSWTVSHTPNLNAAKEPV